MGTKERANLLLLCFGFPPFARVSLFPIAKGRFEGRTKVITSNSIKDKW